ncbi:bifunctional metallophosphatase/5'-nucleotidase [Shewanella sp. KX20019]|uniref:bifunctional metallophosphatase/5'-nucleotidase n=1 Tax=Shewanella sp. KX20019 TaxID=2803864 RepID=UPI0019279F11|nr:bifunctional metallophosphatase/5'-nucleotidase [Shewanella sp. KX20019]QQX78286.1 bifunctional metallophosphatase/5'-nucleotidase [Shewanella sp. KX20019]
MKLQKTVLAIALMAALSACSNDDDKKESSDGFNLTIAHVNDTHSNFDPVKSSFTMGEDGELVFNEFGGYPRILEAANDIKEQATDANQPLLFLHGGDAWQGTAYFKLNEGAANADLLSLMGLDAMALGNHEFDLDTAKLASFIDSVNFPLLANNIDTGLDASLSGSTNLKPYQLFAFDGASKRKINEVSDGNENEKIVAVIGVVLEDMPTIATGTGDVKFESEIFLTQITVDSLKAQGVNKIVVLSHIGNARDIALAAGTHGIDVIVGGHSHTLLGDFTDLGHGDNGTYAQLVEQNDKIGQTCIVQAGQYAQAIGKVEVQFNNDGGLVSCAGQNTLLTNEIFYSDGKREAADLITGSEHEKVESFIDASVLIDDVDENDEMRVHIDATYMPALDAAYGEVVANAPKEINHERRPGDAGTDMHGSDVAPLIAQGMIYWANQASVKSVTGKKVQIGLVGAGGVRTDIASGDFREGNASLELLPFANYLSVLTINGATLKDLLTTTINETLPQGSHAGKFPYVGGMRYTFTEDVKNSSGTITALDVNTGTEAEPIWAVINGDEDYVVIVNNYNASGNDGWNALGDAQLLATDRIDLVKTSNGYKAYEVDHLTYNASEKTYSVVYTDAMPSCDDNGVDICNTDALSFIDYAKEKVVLENLPFETTTVIYK